MMASSTDGFLGRNPDDLSLVERRRIAGKWIAMECYTPANLALRRIAAMGDSPADCQRQLRDAGKNPALFQFLMMNPPAG